MSRSIAAKLAFRLYSLILRKEAMIWLKLRRRLIWTMTGKRSAAINIFPDVFIEGYESLRLGNSISFNRGCNISATGGLTIGDHVSIGHATSIITANHGFRDPATPIRYQPSTPGG